MMTEQMDESITPPQIIDNSAVIFSNTKRKKGQAPRQKSHSNFHRDTNKSEDEVDYKSVIDGNQK